LLTAKNASSEEPPSGGTLVEVAENMKIILPSCREKQGPISIKIAFFRGKMEKHGTRNWRGRR
jgi:hypothetical protein